MYDLRKVGERDFICWLGYSKTQQIEVTVDSTPGKPILRRCAEGLMAWRGGSGMREGAIFRRIWRGRVGPPLLSGVDPQASRQVGGLEGEFGVHSLRSGFVTEAGKQGVPLSVVMAMSEHCSVASVTGYF
ncbi:hypothetical protein A7X68_19085 [Stenotrophomonas maltophilia]|nr:hypothetical protein A7X68_19085 [Stenotrophomonas maltophilia]